MRRLLRSQPALVADTLSRHLRQQHEQPQQDSTTSQPAAATILEYCLSDAAAAPANSAGQALQLFLQQLNGLKLLPTADGQVQALHISLRTDVGRAVGQYSRDLSQQAEQYSDAVVYVTTSTTERQLLQGLPHLMLHEGLGEGLRAQLAVVAAAGASNVHVLTAARFDSHVLGLLLPPSWHSSRGLVEVEWHLQPQQHHDQDQQEQLQAAASDATAADAGGVGAGVDAQQQPSEDLVLFVQLCWRWLADRSDVADVCHWPLLPVTGGKLRLLQQPAQVRLGV